jgi:hypothetical protein
MQSGGMHAASQTSDVTLEAGVIKLLAYEKESGNDSE